MRGNKKFKLAFVSSKIDSGGAEKHLVRLVNALTDIDYYQITLIVTVGGGNYKSLLSDKIDLVNLINEDTSYTVSMAKSVFLLRKKLMLLKPDLIFSLQDGPNIVSILASSFMSIPKIIGVQNNPIIDLNRNVLTRVIKKILKKIYPKASCVIALSKGVANDYLTLVPQLENKIEVIANIGWPENSIPKGVNELKEKVKILACGRLEKQKDYPTLLKAVKLLTDEGIKIELNILGRGTLEKQLKSQCNELGILMRVNFRGFKQNIAPYYHESDIFVLSSLWEGFGNVIVEAMANGLPVIATDCPHGPAEIITNNINGILIPVADYRKLAENIKKLISDKSFRNLITKNAFERAQEYTAPIISKKYSEVFDRYLCVE